MTKIRIINVSREHLMNALKRGFLCDGAFTLLRDLKFEDLKGLRDAILDMPVGDERINRIVFGEYLYFILAKLDSTGAFRYNMLHKAMFLDFLKANNIPLKLYQGVVERVTEPEDITRVTSAFTRSIASGDNIKENAKMFLKAIEELIEITDDIIGSELVR